MNAKTDAKTTVKPDAERLLAVVSASEGGYYIAFQVTPEFIGRMERRYESVRLMSKLLGNGDISHVVFHELGIEAMAYPPDHEKNLQEVCEISDAHGEVAFANQKSIEDIQPLRSELRYARFFSWLNETGGPEFELSACLKNTDFEITSSMVNIQTLKEAYEEYNPPRKFKPMMCD